MEGEVQVQVPVSAQCHGGGESQPRLPYTIDGLRDCASWLASFAAHFDHTAAAAEKAAVEAKSRELGEREEDFDSLGSDIDEKAIRAREVEEELEGKRKELEVKEKEIELKREELEECLNRFRIREKGFERQSAELMKKQAEFQVRLSELNARERGIDEKERQCKELQLEMKHQAEAPARLNSAFELRTEFASVPSPKDNQDSNLIPFLGNTPTSPLDSRTLSGAKRSWSDASADGAHTDSPDPDVPVISANLPARLPERFDIVAEEPDRLNAPAQQPERLDEPDQQPEMLNVQDQQPERSSSSEQGSCSSSSFPVNPEHSGSGTENVHSPSTLPFVPKCLERRENNLRLLVHQIKCNELYCPEVSDALQLASDPAEFVLGVVEDPFSLTLKSGDEVTTLAFPEYGPLLVLDCMWRMSPHVNPDVESKALSFAKGWRSRFANLQKNHLNTVCFLLFLAAYKLVSHFIQDDFFQSFNRAPYLQRNGFMLLEILGFKDLIPSSAESSSYPQSGRLLPLCSAFPTNSKHSGLENEKIPSPSTLLFVPTCIDMDEEHLKERIWFLILHNCLNCREVTDALELASDPGGFVLSVVKNPSSLTLKMGNEVVSLGFPRYGPLLLLDRMWRMSPEVKSEVKWEALSFARSWRSDLAKQLNKNDLDTACFMLFLAAYKLVSHFDQDELVSVFGNGYRWCVNAIEVVGILGFKVLIPKGIECLMRINEQRAVLRCINTLSLLKSPSAKATLERYMRGSFGMCFGFGTYEETVAIDEDIKVWKAVAKSIGDENLALSFRAYILDLEKLKEKNLKVRNRNAIARRPPPTGRRESS